MVDYMMYLKSETQFPSEQRHKFIAVGLSTSIPLKMRFLLHCERQNCQQRRLLLGKIMADLGLGIHRQSTK